MLWFSLIYITVTFIGIILDRITYIGKTLIKILIAPLQETMEINMCSSLDINHP